MVISTPKVTRHTWKPFSTQERLVSPLHCCDKAQGSSAGNPTGGWIDLGFLKRIAGFVAEDERFFVPLAWDEPERVLLRDKDGKEWWLDPQTGDVVKK